MAAKATRTNTKETVARALFFRVVSNLLCSDVFDVAVVDLKVEVGGLGIFRDKRVNIGLFKGEDGLAFLRQLMGTRSTPSSSSQ